MGRLSIYLEAGCLCMPVPTYDATSIASIAALFTLASTTSKVM